MSNKHKCICAGCGNEHDDRGEDDHPDSHQWYVNLGVPSECMCNYGLEGYPDCPKPNTVTITISREDLETIYAMSSDYLEMPLWANLWQECADAILREEKQWRQSEQQKN